MERHEKNKTGALCVEGGRKGCSLYSTGSLEHSATSLSAFNNILKAGSSMRRKLGPKNVLPQLRNDLICPCLEGKHNGWSVSLPFIQLLRVWLRVLLGACHSFPSLPAQRLLPLGCVAFSERTQTLEQDLSNPRQEERRCPPHVCLTFS